MLAKLPKLFTMGTINNFICCSLQTEQNQLHHYFWNKSSPWHQISGARAFTIHAHLSKLTTTTTTHPKLNKGKNKNKLNTYAVFKTPKEDIYFISFFLIKKHIFTLFLNILSYTIYATIFCTKDKVSHPDQRTEMV